MDTEPVVAKLELETADVERRRSGVSAAALDGTPPVSGSGVGVAEAEEAAATVAAADAAALEAACS